MFLIHKQLKGLFGVPLNELPAELTEVIRLSVIPRFSLVKPWDDLSPEEQYAVATLFDYLQHPATKQFQQYDEELTQRKKLTIDKIKKVESTPVLSITELERQEYLLSELSDQLRTIEYSQNSLNCNPVDVDSVLYEPVQDTSRFIPYPQAFKLLEKRLSASPEEIAAWVYLGQNEGGLAAYIDINNSSGPSRFHFKYGLREESYLAQLMSSWFLAGDVTGFQPEDRFITGRQLIEHWQKQSAIQVDAFIKAKIDENRLRDLQPIVSTSQWCKESSAPSLDSALFPWSEIEVIDSVDFGQDPYDIGKLDDNSYPPNIYHHLINFLKDFAEENLLVLRHLIEQGELSTKQIEAINRKIQQMEDIQRYKPRPILLEGESHKETPEERATRIRARIAEEKAKGTKNFNEVVAEQEKLSVSRIKQIRGGKKKSNTGWEGLIASRRQSGPRKPKLKE